MVNEISHLAFNTERGRKMKMKKLGVVLAAGVLAASLALFGCSSNSTAGNDTKKDDSAKADTSYTLVTDGTLTMGTSADYPPFENLENGEAVGFDVDLCKAVAVMKDGAITKDNAKEELNKAGVIIAVQSGTTGETYCRENFPNATIQPYGNSTDSFAAMQAGQATAVCTNAAVVKKMLSEAYSDAQVVLEVATGEEYAVAVNKDNPELTKAINEAIKKLQDDGTVEKLAAKWLG
jgi:ABC-type amino acid transport substrate-binding protein